MDRSKRSICFFKEELKYIPIGWMCTGDLREARPLSGPRARHQSSYFSPLLSPVSAAYSLEERSSPTLDVWAARVGGDTEMGRAHSGSCPQTSARGLSCPRKEARVEEGRQGADSPRSFLSATNSAFPRSRRRALARGRHRGQRGGPSTRRPGGGDKAGRGRPPPGACGACESVCRAQRTDSAGSPCVRGEDAGKLPRPGPAIRSARRRRPLRPPMLSRSLAPLPA